MNVKSRQLGNPFGLLALVIATLMWAGCASTPMHESTGEYVDDSTITTKVKASCAGDSMVKATQVNVETFKGVVQLSGFVDTQDAKNRAEQLARNVRGVVRVENNIIVKPVAGAEGSSASADIDDYSGEITAINGDTLTVKKAMISHDFRLVTGADVIARDGSNTRFSKLQVGDHVKVFYTTANGMNNATRVEVTGD